MSAELDPPGALSAAPVQPFWGRVSIQPFDDQEEAPLYGYRLLRGAVLAVDDLVHSTAKDVIPPGTVVYYTRAVQIGGVDIVDASTIIAFETD